MIIPTILREALQIDPAAAKMLAILYATSRPIPCASMSERMDTTENCVKVYANMIRTTLHSGLPKSGNGFGGYKLTDDGRAEVSAILFDAYAELAMLFERGTKAA